MDMKNEHLLEEKVKDLKDKTFSLNEDEVKQLEEELSSLEEKKREIEIKQLRLGQLLDYNSLLEKGFSNEEVLNFYNEDNKYIKDIFDTYSLNIERRDYMFGYPANLENYSHNSIFLRSLESKLFLMNNCGDPYQTGNYAMDSKQIEKEIISLFAKNFSLKEGEYWGYITSGGTESNFWGIREGFFRYPEGKLYFSKEAHYSVEKYVSNNGKKVYNYSLIETDDVGAINVNRLINNIKEDIEKGVKGIILVLTWGTTCRGAMDDVKTITTWLTQNNIEYYLHLDAAHFGGIPTNQIGAPNLGNIMEYKLDSISISLHKYLGSSRVNGILMAFNRVKRKVIDYIDQEDSTLLGSRDYLPFSTLQRIKEVLFRSHEGEYIKNISYLKNKLDQKGVYYENIYRSNIFVIKKPNDRVCHKYQLATFFIGKEEFAHIIVFPFHKKEVIDELVDDLN